MSVQSSYLFLRNTILNQTPENNGDSGSDVIMIEDDISNYITKAFPDLVLSKEQSTPFKEVLSGRWDSYEIKFTVRKSDGLYSVNVELCDADYEQSVIDCLEAVQNKLLSSGLRMHYIDIISYDAVSEYYCNIIGPILNSFERNLRKLLYNVYIIKYGVDYRYATADLELRKKLNGVVKGSVSKEHRNKLKDEYRLANRKATDELLLIRYYFESFDYSDLQKFLFDSSWNELDAKRKEEFLKNNTDLTNLSDAELRQAFNDYTPKSSWERLFSDKVHTERIKDRMECIREYRNRAAHFKHFSSSDFNSCKALIHDLNEAVIKAIEVSENEDFVRKYKEDVEKASTQSLMRQEIIENKFSSMASMVADLFRMYDLFSNSVSNKSFQTISNVLSLLAMDASDNTYEKEKTDDEDNNDSNCGKESTDDSE